MKCIAFQSVFFQSEGQARLFGVSQKLIARLNPGWHRLVINNNSPIDPRPYAGPDVQWHDFPDNIGHWSYDGPTAGNGPGRANSKGIEIACAGGYDRIVYQESDALCALPYDWWFARMTKPVACQPPCRHNFPDWNVWAMSGGFMREFDFVTRYDWANQPVTNVGEQVYANLFGEHLQMIPVRGERWESDLTPERFREIYGPQGGCDLLTHVGPETFAAFLELNGFADLVPLL